MRGIFTLRKALSTLFIALAFFVCQPTAQAQCPTGNCGEVDHTFTAPDGFTSSDFVHDPSGPGRWIRTGIAANASYSITSGIIATGNGTIANIGFSLYQPGRFELASYTINIRDAVSNSIIAQCTNPSPFDDTADVCISIINPAIANRNVRLEFILVADADGAPATPPSRRLIYFDNVRYEFTATTGIPAYEACAIPVTEDFDNDNGGFVTNTTDIIYTSVDGNGFFSIPDRPGTDIFDERELAFTSGRYQVSATGTALTTGFSFENGGPTDGLRGEIDSLVINIISDDSTILATTRLENDDDDPFLEGTDLCITIRDPDIAGRAIRVQFVFYTAEDASGFFNIDDFRINLPLATPPNPLPVDFISFNLKKADAGVQLLWTVGTEINVDRYEVERSSDGINFSLIGSTPAIGSSSYSFIDQKPLNGVAYYRVRNVDHDGSFAYTPVLKYSNGQMQSIVKVFPTLTRDKVTFQHPSVRGKATVSVHNLEGKALQTLTLSQGAIATPVNLSAYPSGTYILRYVDEGGQSQSFRIFKQ